MAHTGLQSPTVGTTFTGGTLEWYQPENVTAYDGVVASNSSFSTNQTSDWLCGKSYGFSIPYDATITGIYVSIVGSRSSAASSQICLTKNSTSVAGSIKTGIINTKSGFTGYGSSIDLWGTTWTPSEINSSNFGAAVRISNTFSTPLSGSIDYISVQVYYTGGSVNTSAFFQLF